MGHCISVILIKKSELRDFSIQKILENKEIKNNNFNYRLELPCDIIAFPLLSMTETSKILGAGVTFVSIRTDYFGGFGEQSASINITKENGWWNILRKSDDDNAINQILKEYGVIKDPKYFGTKDEFDTINLGKYRDNSDMIKETDYWKENQQSIINWTIDNIKSF
jgi:hypothetical protein